jgi:ribonuclease HI
MAACVTDEDGAAATLKGGELEVMHGELFGIVMALIRARRERKRSVTILTDYWNGIRKIRRIMEDGEKVGGAGKAWYSWILRLIDSLTRKNVVIEIQHVKAHTNEDTGDANLNRKADETAQNLEDICLDFAPIPTFKIDDFVPQSELGYIDKDPYAWVIDKKKQIRTREAMQRYPRLNDSIYERSAKLCAKYYSKSGSDYSIKIQAMIRSHALPTNDRLTRTMGNDAQNCPCGYVETDHHVFV